jgi:hypothetical protein
MDQTFLALNETAEELISQLTKDEIAQCMRLLALKLVDYRRRFGSIDHDERLGLIAQTELSEDNAARLCEATSVLIEHLSRTRDGNTNSNGLH